VRIGRRTGGRSIADAIDHIEVTATWDQLDEWL
jgi:hypothetical protein